MINIQLYDVESESYRIVSLLPAPLFVVSFHGSIELGWMAKLDMARYRLEPDQTLAKKWWTKIIPGENQAS